VIQRWFQSVRPGEGRALGWSFAYFFCLLAGYYVLRPLRDEMGVAGGVRNLQWLFTATFLVMLAAVPLYGALVARLPRRRFIPLVYHFFVANLALFWLLLTFEVEKLIDYLSPFSEPSRHDEFTFTREWLKSEFGRVNDPRNPDFTVALQLILSKTRFGSRLRAAVDDPRVASGLGINVPQVFAFTFAFGCGLAGLGGALSAEILGLDPYFPLKFMIYFLIVVTVGGSSSITGPFLASLLLGIGDVAGKYYVPKMGPFVIYTIMIVILIWRPNGLFGRTAAR